MEYSGFRAIVIKGGKIALIERWNNGKHYFVLPGGKLEKGESDTDCVVREIKEELNINIVPQKLIYDLIDFRRQGVFLVDWIDGEISKTNAEEYREDRVGGDYNPVLVDLAQIKNINLVPTEMKQQLLSDLQSGQLMIREKIEIHSGYKG